RKLNDVVVNLRSERKDAKSNFDTIKLNNKNIEYDKARKKLTDYPHEFIDNNTDLDVSLLILETQLIGTNQNTEKFRKNLIGLKKVINKNAANKFIGQKINSYVALKEREESISIGRRAPNFKSLDPNGKMLSLDEVKGKVTIIDFWAAWCGPCRRENPNLVSIYQKYHDKGLEIIGVSLDGRNNQSNPKQQWVKAIENDNLTWHQVSSLMYFRDPVAELYNISSIPATFVLNEDGIILAKKLRGKALENKISELLD
ncbi:TlpA family protein disulfide reductase, partial [Flavobacteriaceae bacterium]|nr:TlpA family protein disulfide reductase [Flavobacteriaceae bacterium]